MVLWPSHCGPAVTHTLAGKGAEEHSCSTHGGHKADRESGSQSGRGGGNIIPPRAGFQGPSSSN